MERISKTISETVTKCQTVEEVMEKSENLAEDFCDWLEFSRRYHISQTLNGYYVMKIDCKWYLDIPDIVDTVKYSVSNSGVFESFKDIIVNSFKNYAVDMFYEQVRFFENIK